MDNKPKLSTSPFAAVPRFCGYCGEKKLLLEIEFMIHVHNCEFEACKRGKSK